jgi:hypothetical protein
MFEEATAMEAAELELRAARTKNRPSIIIRPRLMKDQTGDGKWVAVFQVVKQAEWLDFDHVPYGDGYVTGFGSTPAEAYLAFDMAWNKSSGTATFEEWKKRKEELEKPEKKQP